MPTRRGFVAGLGAAGVAAVSGDAFAWLDPVAVGAVRERFAEAPMDAGAASDELLWREVQQAFRVDRTLVNLNNGGVSPSPGVVQDAMARYLAFSNEAPVQTMWRVLEPQKEGVRDHLARHFGCDGEEMAITRNASEGLQICQFGFDLEAGDEVLTTDQDYGRMLNTFRQRERREGVRLVTFPIPVPAEDPAEIVRRFEAHITDRTRLILVSHVVNITGQVMPVREVVALGRSRGIPVIVDGAHAFAQFPYTQADLDCDYYATSLHKWLFAPFGTGFLYVRRDKIEGLWPLMASRPGQDADIRKFEEIGTHPAPNYLAIGAALAFQEGIGVERKAARLRYLRDLWADALRDEDRVHFNSSFETAYGCGIANVAVDGLEPRALSNWLWQQHRIIVAPIFHPDCPGLRVTPSVYTTPSELERFVDAMREAIRMGIA
ncbi:MAG: aminotransferase class V-fold PLP-dependent enzyme [Pseudomonadales bacterium]|jgi:selenocysteine lyase/cysteine desulfurase|nr:aminotransferase class V-fold PLP-dependent enzyme [Pseudomonadales bacterium]